MSSRKYLQADNDRLNGDHLDWRIFDTVYVRLPNNIRVTIEKTLISWTIHSHAVMHTKYELERVLHAPQID